MRPSTHHRGGGTGTPGPEKLLESLVRRSFAARWPRRHMLEKRHGDEYTTVGLPDYSGHVQGRHFELELKVSMNYFSDPQKRMLAEYAATGAVAAGLLHDRRDDTYWLIPGSAVMDFSYRDKKSWLPLLTTVAPGPGLTYLNLTPLEVLLGIR